MNITQACVDLLTHYTAITIDPSLLEIPQDRTMGDRALPCFTFAKQLRKAPQQIAQDIAHFLQDTLTQDSAIDRIVATGPYINFFVKTDTIASSVLHNIEQQTTLYGSSNEGNDTILIESPGPNTNKPLHLGHVRNMLLGNALGNILRFVGHDVHAIDIVNDRGVHICKSMLAYKLRGNNASPDCKPDHYVGKRYVEFAQQAKKDPALNDQAQAMLKQREDGQPDTVALRALMRDRALEGQQETYTRFGTAIEKTYAESDHYKTGKTIVEDGMQTGLFTTNEHGNIVYNDEKMGEKVVLRSDGTAIYITQDIALGKLRYEDRSMDRMIYVVGNEQEDHFKFLFSIFGALGLPFAQKCHHLSYGMVELPDGKMKSREGTVVDADDIANETHQASYDMLKERYPDLDDTELHRRAEIIAMGAIKFFFLKYDAVKNFVYDKNSSLRFDGETGPYVQYTYARCSGIIAKAQAQEMCPQSLFDLIDTTRYENSEERALLIHLNEYPDTIEHAARTYQPYLVARYLLDLAALFNSFYQKHTIIDRNETEISHARLGLVDATRTVIQSGLGLLGIAVLDEM